MAQAQEVKQEARKGNDQGRGSYSAESGAARGSCVWREYQELLELHLGSLDCYSEES
jgi:hypothetical protein